MRDKRKRIRSTEAKIFSAGVLMKCEQRGGWAFQGLKIMLMRKSKGQRTSGWSVLKFENMQMSLSKGQRTSWWSIC